MKTKIKKLLYFWFIVIILMAIISPIYKLNVSKYIYEFEKQFRDKKVIKETDTIKKKNIQQTKSRISKTTMIIILIISTILFVILIVGMGYCSYRIYKKKKALAAGAVLPQTIKNLYGCLY